MQGKKNFEPGDLVCVNYGHGCIIPKPAYETFGQEWISPDITFPNSSGMRALVIETCVVESPDHKYLAKQNFRLVQVLSQFGLYWVQAKQLFPIRMKSI